MNKRVVITGIGVLTALGRGMPAIEEALREGKSGIGTITSFDSSRHKTNIGAEVKNSLIDEDFSSCKRCYLDRASRLVLTACQDAFTSASLSPDAARCIEAPVILGTTLGGMLSAQEYHRDLLLCRNEGRRTALLSDYLSCNQAAHVADRFGLIGEALVQHNACASGLSAIGCAFWRIRSGEASIAVAGGYDVMSEFTHAGFSSLQLVSSDKCRPFDNNRNGLVLGEGVGILMLEELKYALDRKVRIFAEVIGYGQSSDAYHITKPDPKAWGAYNAIMMALKSAATSPTEIDYVNAHGTGTRANDHMEAKALYLALGKHGANVPVSSTKPMTGHLLGGAGAVEMIISIAAINNSIIPENLNYNTPDPECRLNISSCRSKNAQIKTVLSNSFGFGGSNGAIILRKTEKNKYF